MQAPRAFPSPPQSACRKKRRRNTARPPRLCVSHLVHDHASSSNACPLSHVSHPEQASYTTRRPRPSPPRLHDLPEDVLTHILPRLDLCDVLNLRLALAGSSATRSSAGMADEDTDDDGRITSVLRRDFRKRVRTLSAIWHGMSLSDIRSSFGTYIPAAWTSNRASRTTREELLRLVYENTGTEKRQTRWPPSPTDVASMTHLDASGVTSAVAHAITEEMPRLRSLHIYGDEPGPLDPSPFPFLQTLPNVLGHCLQLREVDIVRQAVVTVPEGVLRLHRLETLKLEMNALLRFLPTDIGTRLVELRYVTITRCPVDKLPLSLLDRMERVFAQHTMDIRPVALSLNGCAFPPGYLAAAVCPLRHPLVRHRLVG